MKKPLKIALWLIGSVLGLVALVFVGMIAIGSLIFGSFMSADDEGSATISWRSSLPSTATEVQEHAWADGFLPDYNYYLRARITQPEFDQLVQDLELTPHTPTRIYSERSWISWSGHLASGGTWWNPSDSLEGTYVKEAGTEWMFAKYENGYLYFRSLDH